MTKKVVIYGRTSTTKNQSVDHQLRELREISKRNNWEIVEEYLDKGISGSLGRDGRPSFDRLLKDVNRKKFDGILVWSIDRLGRSLQDLVSFLNDVQSKNIDLYIHQQGLDTSTPTGKMMFQMCGVFAEFERSMIRERVMAGLDRARSQGKRLGRPPIPPITVDKIKRLRGEGLSLRKIAKQVGISTTKVHQLV